MSMLGYEPPQPKLWKAVVGAAVAVFPLLYIADVAVMHHRPGWVYFSAAVLVSIALGRQMHRKGPEALRRIPIGAPISKVYGGASWQPPDINETRDTD